MGYDEIRGVNVLVGCKIPGVNLGYDESRQVKMKNPAVKLIVLDSNIDYNNVGESTGVDVHAHEVARHQMVLPMDQKVAISGLRARLRTLGNTVKD